MKLLYFLVITFLTLLIVVKTDRLNPSFLKHIGSYKYNTTEDGKITLKRYYLSQRVHYTWIDSFMTCKSVGMRLASLETEKEINNLEAIARSNNKLFEKSVFIDGQNGTYLSQCMSLRKEPRKTHAFFQVECYGESKKFLCEDFEVVDSYDDPFLHSHTVDFRTSIFTYLGNFEKKRYYAGFDLRVKPNDVQKICQSFDMNIASPQNQAEYDNLGNLLRNFTDVWYQATIGGVRSEENQTEWVSFNNKVDFQIDWDLGEPNNVENNEHCLAIVNKGEPKMNDRSCTDAIQFICEFDESINQEKKSHEIDYYRFLKPLTNYNFGSFKKQLFLSVYSVDWFSALLNCKLSGMELAMSSSKEEDKMLIDKLKKIQNLPTSMHVGATSIGTDEKWYSIHTGEIFNYELEWALNSYYYAGGTKCLRLRKYTYSDLERIGYDDISCIGDDRSSQYSHYLCQKIVERTEEEEETITSTSETPLNLSTTTVSTTEETPLNLSTTTVASSEEYEY